MLDVVTFESIHKAVVPSARVVIHLHPCVARCWDGLGTAEQGIDNSGYKEAAEEVESVDICCTNGYGRTDGTSETNHVNENARDVGGAGSPGNTIRVVVRAVSWRAVQVSRLEATFPFSTEADR